jgi:hypothetical protein
VPREKKILIIIDVSNPESYEDLVKLLVPVLQKRGLMWGDYPVVGGSYRENLLGTPGHPTVPDGHPAAKFRYENLKGKYTDEKGDIYIDKRSKTEDPAKTAETTVPIVKTNGVKPAEVKVAA